MDDKKHGDQAVETEFQNLIMQKFADEIQTIALKTNKNSDIWRTARSMLETVTEIGGTHIGDLCYLPDRRCERYVTLSNTCGM